MNQLLLYVVIALSASYTQASLLPRSWSAWKNSLPTWSQRKGNFTYDFPKYFHEAGKGPVPNHYDGRYQHGFVSPDVQADTEINMVRAYLQFFREKNLETWLAHGTLLGWWWNGRRLPWDSDTDMQVAHPTLVYLAEHYNNTIYEYSSEHDDPSIQPPVKRSYLLDINPAYIERVKGNGNNVIDARWIDMRNGLFIDLTGVSETLPERKPGVWSCKNDHHYNTSDLFPMRETVFEGVVAKVPYAYVRILTEEYQEKALVVTEYEGHKWNSDAREWVKKTIEELKADRKAKHASSRKKVEDKKMKQLADKVRAKQKGGGKFQGLLSKFGAPGEKKKASG